MSADDLSPDPSPARGGEPDRPSAADNQEHVIGVLVSGRGSNLLAILEAIERGELRARVGLVISSRAEAPALSIAADRGIPTRVLRLRDFASRAELGAAIVAALHEADVELMVLAGYNLIFDPCVIHAFPDRILNIHPSLLPAFAGGMAPKPQTDALAAGVKISGCSVHYVTEEVDSGPILAQAAVTVRDDDTVETLSARILAEEHRQLPQAIALALSGRVRIKGQRTYLVPAELDE